MAIDLQTKITYVYHSNRLDGVTLSQDQTAALLQGEGSDDDEVVAPDEKSYEPAVVRSHGRVLDFVAEQAQAATPLTVALIQDLHRRLMDGVILSNGEFRECTLKSRGIPPLPAEEIPNALGRLAKFANDGLASEDNLEHHGWRVHHEFLGVHPFIEGNGRLARLLMTYMRLRASLPLLVVRFEDQPKYAASILRYFEKKRAAV